MLEGLHDWFLINGTFYALIGLFLILVIDSMIFPTLPEVFAVAAFFLDPTLEWGLIILLTACCAEVTGNSLLYALVRKKKLPNFIQKAMKKWVGFLFLRDERILLLNRVAPVVPFTGAFIATCEWSYKLSMAYLVVGGAAKYGLLLALVGLLNVTFDPDTAQLFTLFALAFIISFSFAASYFFRKRIATGDKENL
jgi:membrane protein YqaA with SNARE-associated domain